MKSIYLVLMLTLAFSLSSYGQYPVSPRITFPIITHPVDKAPVITNFKDTLDANKTLVKDYEGAMIRVGDKMYFRWNKRWVELLPASGLGLQPKNIPENKKCCCCNCKNK